MRRSFARRNVAAYIVPVLAVAATTASAQWTQLWDVNNADRQSQPESRAAHAMVNFKDALFIFGGIGGGGGSDTEFGDTWRFDLLAQKWTKAVADTDVAPSKRFHHTGALHSNATTDEFVIFGGLSITSGDSAQAAGSALQLPIGQYNDVWRLKLRDNSSNDFAWTKDPVSNATGDVVPTPRSEAGVVVHNDQMFMFGGITYDSSVENASPVDSNELWSYNLSSCTWTLLVPVNSVRPPKRFSHSVTLLHDESGAAYLVVFSGRQLEYASWKLLDDTWLYAIEQNQWLYVASTSTVARAYTSLVSVSAMDMWFFGGYFKPKQGPNGYVYDDVVAGKIALSKLLNGDSSSVETTTTTPITSSATPPNMLHSDVSRLTPQSLAITSPVVSASMKIYYGLVDNTQVDGPALRYNHRAAAWRGCMVIHGGSYQSQYGDVWLFNTTGAQLHEDARSGTLPMDAETLVYVLGGFIISIVTILMILLIRWRRVDHHQTETVRQGGDTIAPHGVSPTRLAQLPITKYKRPQKAVATPTPTTADFPPRDDCEASMSEDLCPICLIEFEDNEDVRNLPCKHLFHVACIDEWFQRNTTCPMCKTNVDIVDVSVNLRPASPRPPAAAAAVVVAPQVAPTPTVSTATPTGSSGVRNSAVVIPVPDE